MFSGFLGGGLISTSEHESADSHGRFQITITGSQCLREALWEMQRSQTCCAVLFFITLHPLNPSSILGPNACAFHLASLCPGPNVGGSWCQEQGPGKLWQLWYCDFWWFLIWPVWSSMKYAKAFNTRDHWKISRRLILHLGAFGIIWAHSMMFAHSHHLAVVARPPLHTCVFATVLKHRRQGDVWYCLMMFGCLKRSRFCLWYTPCFNFRRLVVVECLAAQESEPVSRRLGAWAA